MSVVESPKGGRPAPNGGGLRVTVIQPHRGFVPLDLREIWEYRELLVMLTRRDLTTRYKQTVLGILWAIVQPVFTMLIFGVIFGRVAKMPTGGIEEYHLFSYTGLVPWTFFSLAMGKASNSLVGNAFLLKKVYLPRVIIPLASTLAPLVDMAIAFSLLLGMMAYYGHTPSVFILLLPLFVLLAHTMALGMGLWLSALNVQFRDIAHVIPFLTTILLYATPIAYSSALYGSTHSYIRSILLLNPMAQVVEGFRWCIFHDVYSTTFSPDLHTVGSIIIALAILISGAYVFRRMERTFADTV